MWAWTIGSPPFSVLLRNRGTVRREVTNFPGSTTHCIHDSANESLRLRALSGFQFAVAKAGSEVHNVDPFFDFGDGDYQAGPEIRQAQLHRAFKTDVQLSISPSFPRPSSKEPLTSSSRCPRWSASRETR